MHGLDHAIRCLLDIRRGNDRATVMIDRQHPRPPIWKSPLILSPSGLRNDESLKLGVHQGFTARDNNLQGISKNSSLRAKRGNP